MAEPVAPLAGLVDLLDPDGGDLPPGRPISTRTGSARPRLTTATGTATAHHDPYVPRTAHDVDIRLRAALVAGRMVLVVGPSKSGKTRTAFEAIRARWGQAQLAAPAPGSLAGLAAHPRLQTSSDPLVVWLDDLDRFLHQQPSR